MQVDVVSVPVTVTDARGEFVGGLTRDNFRLFVDGTERPIEYFAAEAEPAKVLLLIETGPAVYLLRREHTAAALLLLQGLGGRRPRGDRQLQPGAAAVTRLHRGQAASGRRAGGRRLRLWHGATELLRQSGGRDGLGGIARRYGWRKERHRGSLTTGLDSLRPRTLGTLGEQAATEQRHGAARGAGRGVARLQRKRQGEARHERRHGGARRAELRGVGPRAAAAIAAETGGYAFFPRSTAEFEAAYRRIAGAHCGTFEYNVGFSAPERDARYHEIRVEVLEPGRPAGSGTGAPPRDTKRKPKYTWNARHRFLAPSP